MPTATRGKAAQRTLRVEAGADRLRVLDMIDTTLERVDALGHRHSEILRRRQDLERELMELGEEHDALRRDLRAARRTLVEHTRRLCRDEVQQAMIAALRTLRAEQQRLGDTCVGATDPGLAACRARLEQGIEQINGLLRARLHADELRRRTAAILAASVASASGPSQAPAPADHTSAPNTRAAADHAAAGPPPDLQAALEPG